MLVLFCVDFTIYAHPQQYRSFLKEKYEFPRLLVFKQLKQVITHSGGQADAVKSFIRRNSGEKKLFNNTEQKRGRLNQEVELQSENELYGAMCQGRKVTIFVLKSLKQSV